MKDFKDKVAVITGAGSGIGRGLSLHAASLGMRLVLADINQDGLAETMDLVSEHEVEAIARKVDVASSVSVESLAGETFEHFQNCHLLFNNAGVLGPGAIRDTNEEQFKWLMDINIGGCYNGIKAFLNPMLEKGEEGHIVATCSTSGFIAYPMLGLYSASKFAIRGLMSTLRGELMGTNISTSIVCPGEVDTGILSSVFPTNSPVTPTEETSIDNAREMLDVAADDAQGKSFPISPAQAAEAIFSGIQNKDFYIFTHSGYKDSVEEISQEYLAAFEHAKFT
jgi:NADP-dependent 3-hydroxy acid dehydrogenase YdfG